MNNRCRCSEDKDTLGCFSTLCLRTGRVGCALDLRLAGLSPALLFKERVASEAGYRTMAAYLHFRQRRDEWDESGKPRTRSSQPLCVTVLALIVVRLSIPDRQRFGQTCRFHQAVVNRLLLLLAAHSLRSYGLSVLDVQFLQFCTKAMIAGSVLNRMLYWPRQTLREGGRSPASLSLDFYCRSQEGSSVATFLAHVTGRTIGAYDGDIHGNEGIWDGYTLADNGAFNINVLEAWSESPMDAVLQLPTTADLNIWSLDRFWIPYPASTFSRRAMTTPARLPIR
ncbi:hypothetical protein C8R43DRAFT_1118042 [Mycena crocata]|nr:hypothetical protein C8R43DRAFT_1118042 [Mycena crocata]